MSLVKNGVFKVISATEMETRTKKRYLNLILKKPQEEGGDILNAKMWQEVIISMETKRRPKPEAGQVWVNVSYEEDSYQGMPQLIIRSYEVMEDVTEEWNIKFREPHCVPVDSVIEELFDWECWEPPFQKFFHNLREELETSGLWEAFCGVPAGSSNHHSERGGLLKHIQEMVHIAEDLCQVKTLSTETETFSKVKGPRHFEGMVDFQVLRAGIILHDMGKIHDYDLDTLMWKENTVSKSLGHSQWGILAIERNFPEGHQARKLNLQHVVLTHHGRSVAPTPPATAEALLIHQIDAISAHMDVVRTTLEKQRNGEPLRRNMMIGCTVINPGDEAYETGDLGSR